MAVTHHTTAKPREMIAMIDRGLLIFLVCMSLIGVVCCVAFYFNELQHEARMAAVWTVKGKISNIQYTTKGWHGSIWTDLTKVVFYSGEEITFIGDLTDTLPVGSQVQIKYKLTYVSDLHALIRWKHKEAIQIQVLEEGENQ